jgi:Ca-activated chloride channel family protein
MQKLGTMRPRNRRLYAKLTGLFSILILGASLAALWAQSAQTQPSQPNSTAGQSSTTAPSQQAPATGTTPAQTPANQAPATGTAPATQVPAAGSQAAPAAQTPGGQAPGGQQPPADQGQAQGPSATDNGTFVFRTEAREVVLHATVVDDRNRLITSLTKPDFTVFENGQPQQIRQFKMEDYPVAMGIVVDNSGSMREKREEVNKAALNLVRSSNSDDQIFVVNFSDEYFLDQDFTSDIKKLQSALEHVESRGGTALYDAVVASADQLAKSPLQRKVLFVVTDGEDDASQENLEEAVHRLQQENGPVVYAIGLLGDDKTRRAKRALELLADRTGGIAFFPPTLGDVDQISSTIAHDIRNQYTISYQPATPKSVGGFRTIHVDAHARPYKKLTVRTRSGYYPGQENVSR